MKSKNISKPELLCLPMGGPDFFKKWTGQVSGMGGSQEYTIAISKSQNVNVSITDASGCQSSISMMDGYYRNSDIVYIIIPASEMDSLLDKNGEVDKAISQIARVQDVERARCVLVIDNTVEPKVTIPHNKVKKDAEIYGLHYDPDQCVISTISNTPHSSIAFGLVSTGIDLPKSNNTPEEAVTNWLSEEQINLYKGLDDLELEHAQLAVLYKYAVKDKYHLKHSYLLGGTEDFRTLLHHIKQELTDNQEFILALRPYIHVVPVYIRRIHGEVHALIIDPQNLGASYAPNMNIAAAIKEAFPDAVIHSSSTQFQLQSDNRSCSMFGAKIMSQCAKHGKKILETLASQSGITEDWNGITIRTHDIAPLLETQKADRAVNVKTIIGNTDKATQKRHQFRDEKLPKIMKNAGLINSKSAVDSFKVHQIIQEMSGISWLGHNPSPRADIAITRLDTKNTLALIYTPAPQGNWEHANFPRYLFQGVFPGHVSDKTTQIVLDGFTFMDSKCNRSFRASVDKASGKVTYTLEPEGDALSFQHGLEAFLRSSEYQALADAQHNMRQELALRQWIYDALITVKLEQITTDNKGGFALTDITSALQHSFYDNPFVHVVTGHEVNQAENLSISLISAMQAKEHTRFFVFPYDTGAKHMVEVIVDKETKTIQLLDHHEDKRKETLKDRTLKSLAYELGYTVVDAYPESPYVSQQSEWECGVLAYAAINAHIASATASSSSSAGLVQEKQPLDCIKEAEKILYISEKNQSLSPKETLGELLVLWQQYTHKNGVPTGDVPNWVTTRLGRLSTEVLHPNQRGQLHQYFDSLVLETKIDDNKRRDLRGIIDNTGEDTAEGVNAQLQAGFNYIKPYLPEGEEDVLRTQLSNLAFAAIFEKTNTVPEEKRNADKALEEAFLRRKEEVVQKRLTRYRNDFSTIFDGENEETQKRWAERHSAGFDKKTTKARYIKLIESGADHNDTHFILKLWASKQPAPQWLKEGTFFLCVTAQDMKILQAVYTQYGNFENEISQKNRKAALNWLVGHNKKLGVEYVLQAPAKDAAHALTLDQKKVAFEECIKRNNVGVLGVLVEHMKTLNETFGPRSWQTLLHSTINEKKFDLAALLVDVQSPGCIGDLLVALTKPYTPLPDSIAFFMSNPVCLKEIEMLREEQQYKVLHTIIEAGRADLFAEILPVFKDTVLDYGERFFKQASGYITSLNDGYEKIAGMILDHCPQVNKRFQKQLKCHRQNFPKLFEGENEATERQLSLQYENILNNPNADMHKKLVMASIRLNDMATLKKTLDNVPNKHTQKTLLFTAIKSAQKKPEQSAELLEFLKQNYTIVLSKTESKTLLDSALYNTCSTNVRWICTLPEPSHQLSSAYKIERLRHYITHRGDINEALEVLLEHIPDMPADTFKYCIDKTEQKFIEKMIQLYSGREDLIHSLFNEDLEQSINKRRLIISLPYLTEHAKHALTSLPDKHKTTLLTIAADSAYTYASSSTKSLEWLLVNFKAHAETIQDTLFTQAIPISKKLLILQHLPNIPPALVESAVAAATRKCISSGDNYDDIQESILGIIKGLGTHASFKIIHTLLNDIEHEIQVIVGDTMIKQILDNHISSFSHEEKLKLLPFMAKYESSVMGSLLSGIQTPLDARLVKDALYKATIPSSGSSLCLLLESQGKYFQNSEIENVLTQYFNNLGSSEIPNRNNINKLIQNWRHTVTNPTQRHVIAKTLATHGITEAFSIIFKDNEAAWTSKQKGELLKKSAKGGHADIVNMIIKSKGKTLTKKAIKTACMKAVETDHYPIALTLFSICQHTFSQEDKKNVFEAAMEDSKRDQAADQFNQWILTHWRGDISSKVKGEALKAAANQSNMRGAKTLLTQCGEDVSLKDKKEAFRLVTRSEENKLIKLAKQVSPEIAAKILHEAVLRKDANASLVSKLLRQCTQITVDDKADILALAGKKGKVPMVRLLLEDCGKNLTAAQVENVITTTLEASAVRVSSLMLLSTHCADRISTDTCLKLFSLNYGVTFNQQISQIIAPRVVTLHSRDANIMEFPKQPESLKRVFDFLGFQVSDTPTHYDKIRITRTEENKEQFDALRRKVVERSKNSGQEIS